MYLIRRSRKPAANLTDPQVVVRILKLAVVALTVPCCEPHPLLPWDAENCNSAFEDSDYRPVCPSIDVELRAYGTDARLSAVDDERPLGIFGHMKEGLTLQQLDRPFASGVSETDL